MLPSVVAVVPLLVAEPEPEFMLPVPPVPMLLEPVLFEPLLIEPLLFEPLLIEPDVPGVVVIVPLPVAGIDVPELLLIVPLERAPLLPVAPPLVAVPLFMPPLLDGVVVVVPDDCACANPIPATSAVAVATTVNALLKFFMVLNLLQVDDESLATHGKPGWRDALSP